MRTVRIVNPKQCAYYMKSGVKPLELILDETTNKLVYLFDANSTKPMWEVWKRHEADI